VAEDAQPVGIAEDAEAVGDVVEEFIGKPVHGRIV
jgi:hypothetical protein